VLTIAIPRRGRALPLLSVVYERDKLPEEGSQNLWEQEALGLVLTTLPPGVRPIDRSHWIQATCGRLVTRVAARLARCYIDLVVR